MFPAITPGQNYRRFFFFYLWDIPFRVTLTGAFFVLRRLHEKERLLKMGATPIIVHLLSSESDGTVEGAAKVLAHLCRDCEVNAEIVRLDAIPMLVTLLHSNERMSTRITAAAALMQISVDLIGKMECNNFGVVMALADAMQENNETLLLYCLQCVANIGEDNYGRQLLRPLAERIAVLMNHSATSVQHAAMLASRTIHFEYVGGSGFKK